MPVGVAADIGIYPPPALFGIPQFEASASTEFLIQAPVVAGRPPGQTNSAIRLVVALVVRVDHVPRTELWTRRIGRPEGALFHRVIKCGRNRPVSYDA